MKIRHLITRLAVPAVLLGGLCVPAAASAAPLPEWPLQGYWPMFEGAGQKLFDVSGRGNTGTVGRTRAPDGHDAAWVTGLMGVGTALRFDGDDYIEVPETATLRPKKVSVDAWVRADKSPGLFKYIVSKGGKRCSAGSFGIYTSINGGAAFYVYDGARWHRSPMVSTAIWDGAWHHVAGTFDGSVVRFFVDGDEMGTGTRWSGDISYDLPQRPLYIGAYRGACDLTFEGDIDEVRLWNAALPISALWENIRGSLTTEPAAPGLPKEARAWADFGQ